MALYHCGALLPVFEDGVGTAGACCGWGVPRVQVPVAARRTFPCVAVVFVATWRQEEAALIKSRPSHFSPSPPFQSPSLLKKINPSLNTEERTEKGRRGKEGERSGGKRWVQRSERQQGWEEKVKKNSLVAA